MSISLGLGCLWLVVANVIAMFPSKDHHWSNAYALIAVGLPLLVWIAVQNGLVIAALLMVAGMSVLRWPVRYLWRWVLSQIVRPSAKG